MFAAATFGTTLPTPLYVIYQAQWHFSAAMVTVIFAVYAAAVLVTLLVAGRSSDQACAWTRPATRRASRIRDLG